jgi:hypothetical protein
VIDRNFKTELPQAHQHLCDALLAKLSPARLHAERETPWSSITFSGARHHYVFDLDGNDAGPRGTNFATQGAHDEFCLRGHVVADMTVTANAPQKEGARITIEALTVEAA